MVYGESYPQASTVQGWAPSGTLTTTDAPQQPVLDEARSSLEAAITDLQDIAAALWKYSDATLGSIPTAGQPNTNPKAAPQSRAETLRERLGTLHSTISNLRHAANRIHAI